MLSSIISPHISGTYSFVFIPTELPIPFVESLLPSNASLSLESSSSSSSSSDHPKPKQGYAWVIIVLGQQRNTGMNYVPGGKSTFYEAKLEIPLLTYKSESPITYKQTLLFSSAMMSFSSNNITGLTSNKATFEIRDNDHLEKGYFVKDWIELGEIVDRQVDVNEWKEEDVKAESTGWWIGDKTGANMTKFTMNPVRPAQKIEKLSLKLNLVKFSKAPFEKARELLGQGINIDDEGWYTLHTNGWSLEEKHTMQIKRI